MKKIEVRWIALSAATLAAIYLCWLMLRPFIEVLMWAAVLVVVFYPVHKRLVARTKSPSWSSAISCLIVITTILLPLTLVTLAVVNEVTDAAQNLQRNVEVLLDPESPQTGRFLRWLDQYFDTERLRSQQFIAERLQAVSGAIAGRTLGVVGGIVGLVVEIFFVIFTMYYLFRDGERIRTSLKNSLPLERAQAHSIFERTREVISASLYGVLVIAAIQGALGGVAFWALGLPSPLLWGVVMLFMSMIPMAGAFIVWVPAAIYLAATGAWLKAILLTVWGALVIGTVDNFLRPRLVGERTRLHELLIFFSVLGGLQVFGVLGLVMGPVIVAITLALLDVYRQAERPVESTMTEPTVMEKQDSLRNVPAE